jgi:hypothetical protein
MPSTAKQAETTAFESVRAKPFTRVHGRPTRRDYEILKEEACAPASEVEDITYVWSKNLTDNYGLLADIMGVDEYDDLTGISTYVIPNEPESYDPNITNATPTHTRKRMEEEWELVRTSWFIRKGFLRGVVDNLRDALDEQFYSQLRHRLTAYRNITPYQILEHLNTRWCPLDVKAKKELKTAYYTKWEHTIEHLTAFGKRLDDDQRALVRSDVTIADDDKLQFYLEEIYDSNRFDKQEMLTWERQPTATKTDFDLAKAHFEEIVNATDTYEQNAGGGTAGRNRYESANQMADHGDEIREYIQQLASASAANNAADSAANIQTKNKLTTMEEEIKKLTATIASMANKLNNNHNPNPNGENINPNNGSNAGSQGRQFKKSRNMGAYCSSHGFHPVGINHDSVTCIYKKPEHKIEATWCNRLGGDMYWPNANRVKVEQQEHPAWKGKVAPTN